MSSKWYTAEFRAGAIRQVTEPGYPIREFAHRLGASTHDLAPGFRTIGREHHFRNVEAADRKPRANGFVSRGWWGNP